MWNFQIFKYFHFLVLNDYNENTDENLSYWHKIFEATPFEKKSKVGE